MTSLTKVETQISPQASPASAARGALPVYVFVIGAAIMAVALGAELIGFGFLAREAALQEKWLWLGLAGLSVGAAMDLTFGRRCLLAWLKPIVLDREGLVKFLTVAIQLWLLVAIIRMCYLENNAFYEKVMPLAFYGFIIHYFLPRQFRLSFFLLLSLAGIFSVFGLADSAWLIVISLLLIGICHLPIPFTARLVILLTAGVALTAMRMNYIQTPWTKAIWPILASMFIFRMIVYLYDLKHKKAPLGIAQTLAYFFLLPNVAFPLFPVVDYSTFCRTYYNEDQHRIYQRGLQWICWGVIHLIIYRYINYYWVISPEKVVDTGSLIQYLASNYLLIIRLSGQFHLIVGILLLFGFNLPRIMDLYLLASCFTDYWRRVNVYWKEFIQKIFYYPAYFQMRQLGNTAKLILATAFGFLMTWFFHTYQWFWIRGTFNISAPDVLFWSMLALFMLANSLVEAKYGRKRVLVKRAVTFGEIVSRTLRAAGIFVVMMALWSVWISPSLAAWLELLFAAEVTVLGLVAALLLIVAAIGAVVTVHEIWSSRFGETPGAKPVFLRFAMPTASVILLLYFAVQPEYSYRLGGQASNLIADLRTNRLSSRDAELLKRGYYEELNNVSLFNTQLWEIYMKRPDDWKPLLATNAVRATNDFLKYELVPSLEASFKDAPFNTNRWGMRDDDYEQKPLPNTYRIAMVGGSISMGSGVVHKETFESLLEKKLNRASAGAKYARYEVLNFSVGGYGALQRLMTLETKMLRFEPNAIFFVVHPRDEEQETLYLYKMFQEGAEVPYDYLKNVLQQAEVSQKMKLNRALERLEPFEGEIISWIYRRVVEVCRQAGALPILVCLPTEAGRNESKESEKTIRDAEEAGFIVLNLSEVYEGAKAAYLQLAPWDKHPNARGHRIIAEGLYHALLQKQEEIPLGLSRLVNGMSASKSE